MSAALAFPQRDSLFELIYKDAFIVKDEPIQLSSGKLSNHYFDLKQITGNPHGINLIANALYHNIKQIGGIKSIGGLESGSISISTAVSQFSYSQDQSISSFYVRKKPKEYGLSKWIEGVRESPAVLVDDVVTTGQSALKAFKVLTDENIDAVCLFAIIYRDTISAKKQFEKDNGIKIINFFYESEFLNEHKARIG